MEYLIGLIPGSWCYFGWILKRKREREKVEEENTSKWTYMQEMIYTTTLSNCYRSDYDNNNHNNTRKKGIDVVMSLAYMSFEKSICGCV